MPTSPAATTGANALRAIPHSLISTGMAKPINWLSKPSTMIDSAASRTISFWNVVNGPSSSTLPMSTVLLVSCSFIF